MSQFERIRLCPRTGFTGWWAFRSEGEATKTLDEHIEALPNFSVNFTEYWRNRKHEGDVEAAKKTWTAKQVAQLGFTEIASVTEYHRQAGYTGVYATFLPKEVPINELRQEILKGKEEAEISLESFHETGMGADLNDSHFSALFKLNMDEATLVQIIESNSQLASDLKSVGMKIVGAERRREKGHSVIYLKVR